MFFNAKHILSFTSENIYFYYTYVFIILREHTQYVTAATTACGATVRRRTKRELKGLNENSDALGTNEDSSLNRK